LSHYLGTVNNLDSNEVVYYNSTASAAYLTTAIARHVFSFGKLKWPHAQSQDIDLFKLVEILTKIKVLIETGKVSSFDLKYDIVNENGAYVLKPLQRSNQTPAAPIQPPPQSTSLTRNFQPVQQTTRTYGSSSDIARFMSLYQPDNISNYMDDINERRRICNLPTSIGPARPLRTSELDRFAPPPRPRQGYGVGGSKEKVTFKNKSYTVKIGKNGGKYILVDGKKKYVK
jgi:hypothetical protein